jgi:basic membrane protein A
MGLANRGVGIAMDEYNKDLVSGEMIGAVYKAAYDVTTGALEVHDYMSDNTCPVK